MASNKTMQTPYRRLQEENVSLKKRNQELEEISKGHQKLVGFLLTQLNTKDKRLKDFKNEVDEELKDLNTICHILTITKFFDNVRPSQMKQAKDIVDINYVP